MTLHELLNLCPLHRLINKHLLKKVDVFVTADDIANGKPHDGKMCPIARAIKRAGVQGHVTRTEVEIYNHLTGAFRRFQLPDEARSFIGAFDDGRAVEPFNFTLKLKR